MPVNDIKDGYDYPDVVRFEIEEQDLSSYQRAADFLNISNVDIVCVQHEFGIFGGPAGSHLLALLRELRMPVVTTLHTVLREPSADQRRVMQELIARSTRLVVMTERGTADAAGGLPGARRPRSISSRTAFPTCRSSTRTTTRTSSAWKGGWCCSPSGCSRRTRGSSTCSNALPAILAEFPDVVYIVLGATHPNELREQGEAYRLGLERLAKKNRVEKNVIFYNRFVELEELKEFIGAADLYITPYLNEAQITSGTLAYAFGAGKAVVSTPYWHAAELLADDRGVLVPFGDAAAIAREVIGLLRDDTRRHAMRKNAYKLGREMVWSNVGAALLALVRAGAARGGGAVPQVVRHEDAGPAAARAAGAEAGSSLADDRFDRHVPARHLHRAELLRGLLHGRQRPGLHSRGAARRAGRGAGARADAGHHVRRVPESRVRSRRRGGSTTS